MRTRANLFRVVVCALLSGGIAPATTVASVGNPDLNFVPGLAVSEQQALSISWTATQAYRNVTISVPLGQGAANDANPAYAFLTNRIGPGTTQVNEIAHSVVSFTPASDPTVEVFRGLNLGAGTYYLTLWSPIMAGGGWEFSQIPSVIQDKGVTIGAGQYAYRYVGLDRKFGDTFFDPPSNLYIPGNYFINLYPNVHLVFSIVADDNSSVSPEPGSTCLLAAGCFLLGLLHTYRSGKSRQ